MPNRSLREGEARRTSLPPHFTVRETIAPDPDRPHLVPLHDDDFGSNDHVEPQRESWLGSPNLKLDSEYYWARRMRPRATEACLSGHVDPRLAIDLKQTATSSSPVIPSRFAYSGPIGLHFAATRAQLKKYQPPPRQHWRETEQHQKSSAQLAAD